VFHFLDVIEKWPYRCKKCLKLRAGPESLHVPFFGVPFDSHDIIVEFFNAMGYFVRKTVWRCPKRSLSFVISCLKLFAAAFGYFVSDIFYYHFLLRPAMGSLSGCDLKFFTPQGEYPIKYELMHTLLTRAIYITKLVDVEVLLLPLSCNFDPIKLNGYMKTWWASP
jgi:hypothetical protein